ncbi:hypothetical protein AAG570_002315 [Ranatra chinensis]|uniref:THD domain-containing protein n=1 Tax=Ranatra chinensis TaxID=642074 RepID=A0ABD0Y760_9HEMI
MFGKNSKMGYIYFYILLQLNPVCMLRIPDMYKNSEDILSALSLRILQDIVSGIHDKLKRRWPRDLLAEQESTSRNRGDTEYEYDYYDDDSDTYDEDDDEAEDVGTTKHHGGSGHQHNSTGGARNHPAAQSSALKRRAPRSIGHKYNVVISQNSKYGPTSKPPLDVQARIVLEKDGYQELVGAPSASVTRHGHGCHSHHSVYERRSRVMVTEASPRDRIYQEQVGHRESSIVSPSNVRRDRKKFNGNGGGRSGETNAGHHGVRHSSSSAGCSSPAVHYEGNNNHPNRMSDGRMKHHSGKVKDWMMTVWSSDFHPDPRAHFRMDRDGYVTIEEPGVYYVYAQLFFASQQDVSGYQIFKNGEIAFQCTVTSSGSHLKRNTCYTGGLLNLTTGDRLSVQEVTTYSERLMRFEKGMSFFGMFKVN